ncbi:MAG TPA: hypothetical protein VFJ02_10270 [Vicinamibacterales bacterium]|nr:hypothetical protein [Vicinamibacterales bacterium]
MTLIERHSQGSRFGRALAATAAIAALAGTVACGARESGTAAAAPVSTPQALAQPAASSPVVVSCEPNQRTLVRPVVVNGAALSQVECVTSDAVPVVAPGSTFAPVAQPIAYRPARPAPVVYDDLGDARIVQRPATVQPARQVVYRDERPIRQKRSVAKSAVIIGSTAGAGAGVGALIGGKKGALIGAAIGGGGATLWDQITRRKD